MSVLAFLAAIIAIFTFAFIPLGNSKFWVDWPSLRILCIFIFLGPLVGLVTITAFTFVNVIIFGNSPINHSIGGILSTTALMLTLGAPISYYFGGLHALSVGLVSSLFYFKTFTLPFFVPVLAALASGLFIGFQQLGITNAFKFEQVSLNIVAALSCWWLVKKTILHTPNSSHPI